MGVQTNPSSVDDPAAAFAFAGSIAAFNVGAFIVGAFIAATARAIDACRYARLAVRTASTNSSRPVGGERRRERGARRWKR